MLGDKLRERSFNYMEYNNAFNTGCKAGFFLGSKIATPQLPFNKYEVVIYGELGEDSRYFNYLEDVTKHVYRNRYQHLSIYTCDLNNSRIERLTTLNNHLERSDNNDNII